MFVLDTFGGQKVKNVAFLKWVSLFLIPVHVVWFMVTNVNILGIIFTYYLFSIVLALLSSIRFLLKETLNSKRRPNHVWIIQFFWFFGKGDNVCIDSINLVWQLFFWPKVAKLEKEQKLKQQVENLNQVAEKLEEKHNQITALENLVQRMEKVSAWRIKGISSQN